MSPSLTSRKISLATSLILLFMLLSSCVTNPVTVQTYDPRRPPPGPEVALPLSLVPGAAQIANGEYLEGIGIIGVLVAASAGVALSFGPDPADPGSFVPRTGREVLGVSSILALTGGLIYSMGDGIVTTVRRQSQFDAIAADPAIIAGLVTVDRFDSVPLFAVRSEAYRAHSPGSLVIRNESSAALLNLRVTAAGLYLADSDTPAGESAYLGPNSTAEIPLTLLFDPSVGAITEETTLPVEFVANFEIDGTAYQRSLISKVVVRGRNATDWADPNAIASYVNPDDPPVAEFARSVTEIAWALSGVDNPDAAGVVSVLHAALSVRGLGWFEDPTTPFLTASQSPNRLDSLQLPRETLRFLGGDSDELTILISALAEACGIESAILFRPGSILVALYVGPNAAAGQTRSLPEAGPGWLILDPVDFPSSLSHLAGQGAGKLDASGPAPYEVIRVRTAWAQYPAGLLPQTPWRADPPVPSEVRRYLDSQLDGR